MVERDPATANPIATFIAYALTSIALASAWHLSIPYGLWIANGIAATVGVTTGLGALHRQGLRLFSAWRHDLFTGAWVGLLLVLLTQICAREILWRLPAARDELVRLYALLRTAPGPKVACPVLLLVVVAEELVFRGAVTTYLQQRHKPVPVTVLSTSLYTLPLLTSGSWLLPLVGFTLGGAWTVARQRSSGLTVPIVTHAIFSLTTFVWLPIS